MAEIQIKLCGNDLRIGNDVYPLIEVTREDLDKFRNAGISSFVVKKDGKLWYTNIPEDLSFYNSEILGTHKCSIPCKRLSAAQDPEGCAKVRGYSTGIEKYPWIVEGYETFNTEKDSFVVCKCTHFESCPPQKKLTLKEIERRRLNLAQHMWPEVESMDDVKKRLQKNGLLPPDVNKNSL